MSVATDVATDTDLAELRAIAEDGRTRPLPGGRQFIVFGATVALASAIHAGIALRVLPLPPMALAVNWFALMLAAAVLSRAVAPRGACQTGVGARVERAVWRSGGWVLGVLALGIFAFAALDAGRTGDPSSYRLLTLMPPVTFGVYAIALAASASAARADYLKPYAAISIAFLALTVMLAGSVWQMAATAAGAVLVSIVPGLALLRRERAHG